MSDIAIIGAGAWGTALALQALRAGARATTLWARDPAAAARIAQTRRNPRLPGFALPAGIAVTSELPRDAAFFVLAVPVQYLRAVAGRIAAPEALVLAAKGVETGTMRLPLEILDALFPGVPTAVLTGPNFAHEVAAGLPTAAVIAATDPLLRGRVAALLATPGFRLYGNDDPIGAEIGGAAKNVIAIAAGAVVGAGLGENARAALVTRGLAELGRLAVGLGGRSETVSGLSGLGDLMLTCASPASRNFSLGVALGRGERLADVLAARTSVTEGVATAPALVARAAALGIDLPVCAAVAELVEDRLTLREAIERLLSRARRDE